MINISNFVIYSYLNGGNNSKEIIAVLVDKNIIALIATKQTKNVIKILRADTKKAMYNWSINSNGDTVMHYTCAKSDI